MAGGGFLGGLARRVAGAGLGAGGSVLHGTRPKVTEENCVDLAWQYFLAKYGDEVLDHRDECPYDLNVGSDEFEYKQVATWLLCERKDQLGRTVIDEFVESFVDDPGTASRLLQMKDLVHDTFVMEGPPDRDMVMEVVSESTGEKFAVQMQGASPEIYQMGRAFTGRIHPWYDNGTHRTTGIITIELDGPRGGGGEGGFVARGAITPGMIDMLLEQMRDDLQESAESITITPTSGTRTLLRELPAEWVDGIYDSLRIGRRGLAKREKIRRISSALASESGLERVVRGLSGDEVAALRLVLGKGGRVKYRALCRKVGADDTGWDWRPRPGSTVGRLRRHGLLVVGRQRISGRAYKVAAIPADVIAPLERCIGPEE